MGINSHPEGLDVTAKISREIITAHLNCKYKAHLKQAGEQGTQSDYEALLVERRGEVRLEAIDKILARYKEHQVARHVPLTTASLKREPLFVLDAILEDDLVSLHFDGLKRVDGSSKLGEFYYIPVLFHEGEHVGKEQRLLLEVYALLLSRLQGRAPGCGIIWHGKHCKATKVRLGADPLKVEQILWDLKQLQGSEPPRLLLNDHCQVCEFRRRCHEQAVKDDDLSLLRGMGQKEIKSYARKGIFTVTQLAHTFRPRRKGRKRRGKELHSHPLQALAIRDRKTYVLGVPQVPDAPVRVYLDIEGKPDEGFVYLIGVIVIEGETETRHSFWADGPEQEARIFDQFLALLQPYADFRVFCYGSYDRDFLRRMRKRSLRKRFVDRVLGNTVNILSIIYAHIHFSVHSNGLKEVGRHLGCSWAEPEASGLQSLVWRAGWERSANEELRQKLVAYNQEDCAALRRVTEFLFEVAANGRLASEPAGGQPDPSQIPPVLDASKLTFPLFWGPVRFFHPEFAYITKCSYFDYQRQRVYIRTHPLQKRARVHRGKKVNRKVRAGSRLVIHAKKCPHCKSNDVVQIPRSSRKIKDPRSKRAFDLVFMSAGVRRRVIQCRTVPYRCLECGKAFLPEQYERLDKHFHGLKSWSMYHHVAHGASFPTIEAMLMEFFGLRVSGQEIHMFKSLLARYYRATYKKLLKRLLAGKVLHIDETEVNLRSGKAYVWVFASVEEVVFMYRPTREGGFLQDLLKGFSGVLVSDFYAAYDSLACPQQKCLIHLIRDMNQDLLNNPFDKELQTVTGAFGRVLRAIVETIDRHGLRRRHLGKHRRAVAGFWDSISGPSFRSEAAEALRQRLLKCKEKLFTFLDYDGVPWNNTNAENAIKRFAAYREKTACSLREIGLQDYLVLLSLCHTCRYRGVSFLKFLLSRDRDIDSFCARKRRRKPSNAIEVYPKGFIPPHLATLRKKKSQEITIQDEAQSRPVADSVAPDPGDE
jgi:predicted RecB family nuclease